MKNRLSFFLGIAVIFLHPPHCSAQSGFEPSVGTYIDSVGADSVLTFETVLYWNASVPRGGPTYASFNCPPGVTADPPDVLIQFPGDGSMGIKFTVNLDSAMGSTSNCPGEPLMVQAGGANIGSTTYSIYIYRYDPNIIGRVRLSSDTVNFGSVPLGQMWYQNVGVAIDTEGSIFRTLSVHGIHIPFVWASNIIPDSFGSCPGFQEPPVSFQPTAIGKYIDTIIIYDTIQNDSTPLILLGEGVAAGVSPDAGKTNSIRINPNPCDRSAAISIPGEWLEDVTVQNILGKRVLELHPQASGSVNLNTSGLPVGIYFVDVKSRQSRYRQRFVVSH